MPDANDLEALIEGIQKFLRTKDKPTLIIVRSHIGYGSPHKQDTHKAHGEPLGEDEVKLTKEVYGWPADEQFLVPEEVAEHFRQRHRRARREAAEEMAAEVRGVREGISRAGRRSGSRWIAASCRTAGTPTLPTFPAGCQGHGHARISAAKCSTRLPSTCRG